jgi:hypothetical protein
MKFESLSVPTELKVETDGLVASAIRDYLVNPKKGLDQVVLAEMTQAFRRTVVRQLMQDREDRKGYESTTLYSGPCARKARLTFDGCEKEQIQHRTLLKFLLGDIVELSVLGIAKLAGKKIGANNVDLTIMGRDGMAIPVHPDGLLDEGEEQYNTEVKSCDSRTFDYWVEHGGPTDDWGYLTQASVEIQAWREAGYEVDSTCFLAVSTGSRQGSIGEWVIPFDARLVEKWHDRRVERQRTELPMVPWAAVPETKFHRGKPPTQDYLSLKHDKNGKVYGYETLTGRAVLPVQCSYCDYKKTGGCWPNIEQQIIDGKPVWYVN